MFKLKNELEDSLKTDKHTNVASGIHVTLFNSCKNIIEERLQTEYCSFEVLDVETLLSYFRTKQ